MIIYRILLMKQTLISEESSIEDSNEDFPDEIENLEASNFCISEHDLKIFETEFLDKRNFSINK